MKIQAYIRFHSHCLFAPVKWWQSCGTRVLLLFDLRGTKQHFICVQRRHLVYTCNLLWSLCMHNAYWFIILIVTSRKKVIFLFPFSHHSLLYEHMYHTWSYQHLPAKLYLYISACKCLLFPDEGSRRLQSLWLSVFSWVLYAWIYLATQAFNV